MYKREGVGCLIPLSDVPRSGQIIIAVHFDGYKGYYANETRLALLNLPNRKDVKNIGIEFYPLDYWLRRSIVTEHRKTEEELKKDKKWSIKRATGGLYKLGFTNMTPEKYVKLYQVLQKMKKKYWSEYEILIGEKVEE